MRNLLWALGFLLLAGCVSEPPKPQYRTLYATPKDQWLLPCPVASPPDRDAYAQVPIEIKLQMMTKAYIAQTKNLTDCNQDKAAIRDYSAKVKSGEIKP